MTAAFIGRALHADNAFGDRAVVPGVFIGTAGWAIPSASADRCSGDGTHLHRYARVFRCAEINSSFYRSHTPAVYRRWADSVGPSFRFAVKLPRVITHDLKLRRARQPLRNSLGKAPRSEQNAGRSWSNCRRHCRSRHGWPEHSSI